MELFRSRVAQSAKAAAVAARQLSSLDDMAQSDEYVQSEGLRVRDARDFPSSASSRSENSEVTSVVEDLSEIFVDALSTAARKHHRPPSEKNQRTPHHLHQARQNTLNGEEGDNKNEPRENRRHTVTHRQKAETQKTKLMPSVAALYDQTDKKRNVLNQSATRGKGLKQSSAHKKNRHDGLARKRGGNSSTPKADLSLATIPSSPVGGQKTNVLLVNEKHAHILHELDYDSDTDSSGDEESRKDSDLEMGVLVNVALHDQLERELEETIERQNSLTGPTSEREQKDVNRFMTMTANLESERDREQEALLRPLESVPESSPTNFDDSRRAGNANGSWTNDMRKITAGEETGKALKAGLSWVRNVASPQLEALSKQIMTKVSEADVIKSCSEQQLPRRGPAIGPRHSPPTENAGADQITMTTSASFLADEDMAELERIRMRNSPSKVRILIQSCLNNPRLAFIVVTLIAALLAYFYSRHKSLDDVL